MMRLNVEECCCSGSYGTGQLILTHVIDCSHRNWSSTSESYQLRDMCPEIHLVPSLDQDLMRCIQRIWQALNAGDIGPRNTRSHHEGNARCGPRRHHRVLSPNQLCNVT